MEKLRHFLKPAVGFILGFSLLAALMLAVGCSDRPGGDTKNSTSDKGAAGAVSSSKLGDLSSFRVIAADTAALVAKGNLPKAVERIKDLEIAWDSAEAGLKPRAAGDWHVVDNAIDRALEALRSDQPTAAESGKALSELLQVIDSMHGGGK